MLGAVRGVQGWAGTLCSGDRDPGCIGESMHKESLGSSIFIFSSVLGVVHT